MNAPTPPGDHSLQPRFQVRLCTNPACGLRFTLEADFNQRGFNPDRCPVCHAPTRVLAAEFERFAVDRQVGRAAGPQLEVMLDNIRSAWNVGAMFRTADGAGVRKIHLCGVTALPDNPKVAKTALGAQNSLPWQFIPDGVVGVEALHAQGMRIWALEGGSRAESLFELRDELPGKPLVLVVGNELSGVDPGVLERCERVVCLPMQGVKGSLNVAVAFGIAVYFIRFGGMNNNEDSRSP